MTEEYQTRNSQGIPFSSDEKTAACIRLAFLVSLTFRKNFSTAESAASLDVILTIELDLTMDKCYWRY